MEQQDWPVSLRWQQPCSMCSCRARSVPPDHPDNPLCCLCPALLHWLPTLLQNRWAVSCQWGAEDKGVKQRSSLLCLPKARMSSASAWHCCSFLMLPQAGQIYSALRATSWLLACNSAELRPCPRDFHVLSGRHGQGVPRVVDYCPDALRGEALVKSRDFFGFMALDALWRSQCRVPKIMMFTG